MFVVVEILWRFDNIIQFSWKTILKIPHVLLFFLLGGGVYLGYQLNLSGEFTLRQQRRKILLGILIIVNTVSLTTFVWLSFFWLYTS